MPENDLNQTTRSDLDSYVKDYSVGTELLDSPADQEETFYDLEDFDTNLAHYKKTPELKKAIDALAIWATGLGFETTLTRDKVILDNIDGWGNDSINDILFNLFVTKKFAGDAFAEIIKNDKGDLINLRPLNGKYVRIVTNNKGRVKRYEYRIPNKNNFQKYKPEDILHLCNDRIGDEIHGTSVIEACKWVIEARKEAMEDWRRISHRSTIRVLYIDIDDSSKITQVKTEYAEGIKRGEVLILPVKKGEAEFEDLQLPPVQAFLQWIQYLENFFYQAVGIPRVIATSENYTEAASKVGFLTFEPIYTHEQVLLEQDIWNQLAIKIKFNRPPSLSGMMQESEEKNTGQTGIQPNELTASVGRNE